MPDMHPAGLPPPPGPPGAGAAGAGLEVESTATSHPPAPVPAAPRSPPRWPTLLAVVIAVISLAVGIAGWFRPLPAKEAPPAPPAAPTFTDQQVADAKARACRAFEVVAKGTKLRTNPEPNDDPAVNEAQGADARLALVAGAWYLRDHLDPATPPDLAAEVRSSTAIMLDVAANAIAGATNSDSSQATLLNDANSAFARIERLCR